MMKNLCLKYVLENSGCHGNLAPFNLAFPEIIRNYANTQCIIYIEREILKQSIIISRIYSHILQQVY